MTYTKHLLNGELAGYRDSEGRSIPNCPGNRHYDAMLEEVGDLSTLAEVDETPVETFEQKMAASDTILPRYVEDLVDALEALGGTVPAELATKVADKKQLRSNG